MTEKNLYEIMFILKYDLGEQQTEKDIKEIKELITSNGGAVTFEDIWGVKDFAYRIENQENGYYVILNFELNGEHLSELNHQLNLNQHILRHLITKTPKNYRSITFEELKKEQELELVEMAARKKEAEDKKKKEQKVPRAPRKTTKPVEKVKEEKVQEETEKGKEKMEKEEPAKKKTQKTKMADLDDVDEKLKNIINDPDISL